MAVVADTSFLIDLGRGDVAALDLLDRFAQEGQLVVIPTPVVAEYLAGARDPDLDLERLERAGEILPLTIQDAQEAGRVARAAFEAGRFPGWMDALIAGFASRRGDLPVVTANSAHFEGSETITYAGSVEG